MEVKAVRVYSFEELKEPGQFMYTGSTEGDGHWGMLMCCPCGCGVVSGVQFRHPANKGPQWDWDGNEESPTLTPSILKRGACVWHGYLTAGVFKEC